VDKTFIDTNILVYTIDTKNKKKQYAAQRIFKEITGNEKAVISTQVLQEFYNASTTKLNVDKLLVKSILHGFGNMEIVQVNMDIIEKGIDISILSQVSFWDGLIIAAAEFAQCSTIISEDLNNGQIIRGVRIVNPFE
jgi:predicted nucleic acid-binding protein